MMTLNPADLFKAL